MRFPLPGAVRPDPRWYQLTALSCLLLYGCGRLGFDVTATRIVVVLGTALTLQALLGWLVIRTPGVPELRSAAISGLSLCLLLRTNSHALAALAAALAVGSKFALRWRGKHLFNPTNFALVALLGGAGGRVWASAGQWGSGLTLAFFLVCLGGLVVQRAARADVSLGFLACYGALLWARSAWLGEPPAIPWHRLQSGALLIFAFFMVSDPRTTPDSRSGRLLFALAVAFGAWYVQFRLFRPNGLLVSLAAGSLLVPLLDRWLPGRAYRWPAAPSPARPPAPSAPLPLPLPLPSPLPLPLPHPAAATAVAAAAPPVPYAPLA